MSQTPESLPLLPEETRTKSARLHHVRRLVPLLVLGVLLSLSWEKLGELDWVDLRDTLHRVPFGHLLLLQLVGLLAVAGMLSYDAVLKRTMAVQMPLAQLLTLSWVANTFNNLVGFSGLTGSGIRYFTLTRSGLNSGSAVTYSLLLVLSVPVGLSVLAAFAVTYGLPDLASAGLPRRPVELLLVLLAAYLPLYLLVTGSAPLLRRLGSQVPPPPWSTRLLLAVISTLDWLMAMGVLAFALWVVGAPFAPAVLLTGFVAAGTAGILSLMPGGLGAFDATLLLVLNAHGIAPEQVGAALLLYRLVYFVVPWVIGLWLGVTVLAADRESRFGQLLERWRRSRIAALFHLPLALISGLSVRVLSWLTLLAGLVLLVSAAFPPEQPRLGLLKQWAPLAAVESSHFLSVVVGVLLVALARGIFSRVQQAYVVTIALLLSGVLFSLLKGLDYEEVVLLLVVALLLFAQRKAFTRNSFALLSRRNAYWLLALLAAVAGYIALGLLNYSDVPYRSALWLHFAWHTDASRFLRSLLALPLGLLALLAWMLFRLPRPPVRLPDAAGLARARALFDEYGGNAFAHLAFMGDKYLFFSRDGSALIQFGLIGDRAVALGDPCGAPQSLEAVILEFREFTDLYDLKPIFYEVSEERLSLYHDLGFALFKLGESARVEVANFTLAGRRGESLRHAVNHARREGAQFAVLAQPLDEATWRRLAEISQAWLKVKAGAEKGFSLGSFRRSYLARSPIAVVTVAGQIVAFANLMPAYGEHDTLSIDLMRHDPQAPVGRVMEYLFVELIELARREGYRYFDLGIAPLSGVGESRYARAQERVAHLAFRYGNRFYNYKGLRSFKEKFHPEWRGVYLAYPFNQPAARLLIDIAALIAGGYRAILFKETVTE
ncbi:MAG TPA: bifunctional lysylphosphatidylglycerol flippase/synthetase MprF [Gammaproteobacteria bacterium]